MYKLQWWTDIDEAKVISALRTSQNTGQSSSSNLKNNQIFGFPCCSTREELSIDVSMTY